VILGGCRPSRSGLRIGGHVQRLDDVVQREVEALDDLAEVARCLAASARAASLALQHVLRQSHAVSHHTADGVDAGVQLFLISLKSPL